MAVELLLIVLCSIMGYFIERTHSEYPYNVYFIFGLIVYNFISAAMLFVVSSRATQVGAN